MIVALDYDKTFTLAPVLWRDFVTMAKAAGHQVICCTMRHESEGAEVWASLGDIADIYFTARKAKADHMASLGVSVDVWIDDCPWFVLNDAC